MKGSCFCGSIAFEISGEIPDLYQCHCSECRKTTGAAANAAATLVTVAKGGPFASHIPLLLEAGEPPRLVGHLAKANPQWQHFATNSRVMAIFHGAHAYVSPTWYEKPGVPTWNYAAVHVYGRVNLIHDPATLRAQINRMSRHFEGEGEKAWIPAYPDKMLDMIVGFVMEVEEVQAKYKLSQNRSQVDRQNVISVLQESSAESGQDVASLMRRTLPGNAG
ncbi:FMN-binding negative transcriptional regulator [Candidatus Thiothrix sp. Deng01]|uniref:FMN-binding negative transcriptional regulator n=1 Tax=Candidatus Thiothrix phosphatis TaxID=3112415 RepID=A0ABU6CWZ8_9GAMM|nr:FMN-binding negative transcriptional regulator [Candidatus Thiothrix sp. Deng01]MEB4591355.1 FMN-binding negative transcriptional regulator [Candidatus Thiothrix sp. Deng01]